MLKVFHSSICQTCRAGMPRVSNPKFFQNASAKLKTVYCFADVYPNSFAHETNMSTLVPYYSYSTLLFKSLGAVRFIFLKEIYTFIQQGCVQLIKSGSKDNYSTWYKSKMNAVLLKLFKVIHQMISGGSCDTEDWCNGCRKLCCAFTARKQLGYFIL